MKKSRGNFKQCVPEVSATLFVLGEVEEESPDLSDSQSDGGPSVLGVLVVGSHGANEVSVD